MNDKNKQKNNNKTAKKKYIVVDCISTFHMRYVVELGKDDPEEWALDDVTMQNTVEFSQKHLDETIVTHRAINQKQVVALARKDNDFVSTWSDEHILKALVSRQDGATPVEEKKVSAPKKSQKKR